MITGVAFTCYGVPDMKQGRHFYEDLLGLKKAESFGESWQEYDTPTGTFAIVEMTDETAPDCYRGKVGNGIAFEVSNLQETLTHLKENNVSVLMEIQDFPGCKMAVVADPAQNVVTLHQKNR